MLIWDNAITTVQGFTSDVTQDTFLKLMMNVGYKLILAELGRPQTEKTKTASTVAAQQYYQAPPDYLWMKELTVTVGSVTYVVEEEESQEMWDRLNMVSRQSAVPNYFFVRPSFGYSGTEFGIWPIPSAVNTMNLIYEATEKDLSQTQYTTGTITVTNGSAVVTGSGTTFTASMVGRYFQPSGTLDDGLWYKVSSVSTGTSLTLENNYQGTTQSGQTYVIAEAFALPDEMQILPCYYAAFHYFGGPKKDTQSAQMYGQLFVDGLKSAKKRYGSKSRNNVIRSKKFARVYPLYPAYFPSSGIT